MSVDPGQFLDKVGFAFADDGKIVELRFARKNGKVAYIQCEYGNLSAVVMHIEQAAGQAFEMQKQALKGTDPRLFGPTIARTVKKMQGAYTRDGKPIISFALSTGMRIDMSIPEDDIRELIAWLQMLDSARSQPKSEPN